MIVAEEKEEDARENYNTLQQEVDIKTRKLKKLYSKLQNTKAEIDDIQEEHRNRMRDLEQTLDQLTRESKFCSLFIDNFIPIGDVTKLENRAQYDEERELWQFKIFRLQTFLRNYLIRSESAPLGRILANNTRASYDYICGQSLPIF